MKSWYQVKVPTGLSHRGKSVEEGKLICLREVQAKLHGDKLEKAEDPKTILDCAFPIEHAQWVEEQESAKVETKQEVTQKQTRTQRKANRENVTE